jgi:hypothetical protein
MKKTPLDKITIAEWYKRHADDEFGADLISTEGRSAAHIEQIGGDSFAVSLTDEHLNEAIQKPGESQEEQSARIEREVTRQTYPGDASIMVAVDWFLDQVSFSQEDRRQILNSWKVEDKNSI